MFWWWWNRRASPQLHAGKITAKTIHMTPHPKRKEGGKKTQTYKNIISKKKNNNNNTQNLRVHHMSATFTAAMDEPRTKNINYYYYYTDTRIHSRHHAAHGTGTRNRFWRVRSCTMQQKAGDVLCYNSLYKMLQLAFQSIGGSSIVAKWLMGQSDFWETEQLSLLFTHSPWGFIHRRGRQ